MVADLSHWINVAETDTNDPDLTAVIEAFASRFRHIHLRVGYDHGPQVNKYNTMWKFRSVKLYIIPF
jgi:hypothetical protein